LGESIVFTVFVIFTGAAVLSTLALYTRQSLLVAYIVLGSVLGPSGFKLVPNISEAHQIGDVGILFLLFLLGLDLKPQKLLGLLRKTAHVTVLTSVIFMGVGYGIGVLFGFSKAESWIIGLSMMFSSTIIGLKLLPTSTLHHRHTGEMMISVLLMQDWIAIFVLVLLNGAYSGFSLYSLLKLLAALPVLLGGAFLVQHYLLIPCLKRFDSTQEYVFLLAVGWCIGLSEAAYWLGLSEAIGAFVAGVLLAAHPIAFYLVESLKPLRDFFLVMFFFSIGAAFNFHYLTEILWAALILAALILLVKPLLFYWLFTKTGQVKRIAMEIGVRLGQGSEFSLLLANLALKSALITNKTAYLIQASTLITFIVSSYWVVWSYPTPIAFDTKMRKD